MRPEFLYPLFTPVTALKGVGPAMAQALTRLGVHTIRDLLWHLPVGTVDRRSCPPLSQAQHHSIISARVTIIEHMAAPPRTRRPYQVMTENESGSLLLTFFSVKGDYLLKQLPIGSERVVSGRVERFHGLLQMPHPDYIVTPEQAANILVVEPVYPLTAGISNKQLRKLVLQALERLKTSIPEWQDAAFLRQQKWLGWGASLQQLHLPQEDNNWPPAQARLAYDELLASQLALALIRRRVRGKTGFPLAEAALSKAVRAALPFRLTAGQEEVMREMATDMASGGRMLRLLQGDVGSGKTVIALLALMMAVDNGMQGVLMAPTEIVCRQHHAWIQALVAPLGIQVGLLTGSEKGKAREALLAKTASGEVSLVIGTHALFQQGVAFHKLGMVVVDEQHRFGVNQRLALAEKAGEDTPPHMLLMSATPIPRTLTMTLFGDLDVSRLTEKPPGRQPIDTRVLPMARMEEVIAGLRRAIATGARVYWVCPLVEASEELSLTAAEERFTEFKQRFPGRVGLVHGRQKAKERQATIEAFARGELDILIATTVIEVGVNIPEATVMVIEHAERFGLAQLHQLRGRVGRGEGASSCLLLYDDKISLTGKERLKVLRDSEDGFVIAEEDLRLRGGGEILGTRQSGLPDFRFADVYAQHELVLAAKDDTALVLHQDPQLKSPRGKALRGLLYLFEYDRLAEYAEAG